MQSDEASFLGKGWSFPPSFDQFAGSADMVAGAEDIRQSLYILLHTEPGQRVLNHAYGCAIRQFVFDTTDTTTLTHLQETIRTAIINYEPRISLNSVLVEVPSMNEGLIFIELDYTIRSINSRYNIVFPYYFSEATFIQKP